MQLDFFRQANDQTNTFADSTYANVLFDTATFDYLIPESKYQAVVEAVGCKWEHGVTYTPLKRPTCHKEKLNDLEFRFTDNSYRGSNSYATFKLTKEMFTNKNANGKIELFMLPLKPKGTYLTAAEIDSFVFGRMFLTHYYAIFNVEQQ